MGICDLILIATGGYAVVGGTMLDGNGAGYVYVDLWENYMNNSLVFGARCDYIWVNPSGVRYAFVGDYCSSDLESGVFPIALNITAGYPIWYFGAIVILFGWKR